MVAELFKLVASEEIFDHAVVLFITSINEVFDEVGFHVLKFKQELEVHLSENVASKKFLLF